MDILGIVDLPCWLLGILTFVLSICLYTRFKQTYFIRNGYTQKNTLFFFGDFIDVINKGFPYMDTSMVQKYGKVFGQYVGNYPSLVICDADVIKSVFVKDFSNFTDRGELIEIDERFKNMLSEAEGSHWKYLRNVLSPTFSSGKVRQMHPYIKRCLDQFHEIIEEKHSEGQDFDIAPLFKGYTMDVICSTGFGLDVNSQRDPDNLFVKYAREFLEFNGVSSLAFMVQIFFPDFKLLHRLFGPTKVVSEENWKYFYAATSSAYEERKKTGSTHKDLLQLMINAHKDTTEEDLDVSEQKNLSVDDFKKRGLTHDEVLMNSLIFMVAAFDTTATTLSWLVYELMLHQDVQTKLRQEIDSEIGQNEPTYDTVFKLSYLEMVVNETLRMHPPLIQLTRLAKDDIEVCGVKIPKGMHVACYPLMLHFMEEYWDKPQAFIPERFAPENKDNLNEYAYMPFGLGPRNCIGMRLALLKVKVTLVSILQKYILHRPGKLKVPIPTSTKGLYQPAEPVWVHLEKREL